MGLIYIHCISTGAEQLRGGDELKNANVSNDRLVVLARNCYCINGGGRGMDSGLLHCNSPHGRASHTFRDKGTRRNRFSGTAPHRIPGIPSNRFIGAPPLPLLAARDRHMDEGAYELLLSRKIYLAHAMEP